MRSSATRADRRGGLPPSARGTVAGALALLFAAAPLLGQAGSSAPSGGERGSPASASGAYASVGADGTVGAGWTVTSEAADRLLLSRGERRVVLQVGNPFARVGGEVVPLANAPIRRGGELLVPNELLDRMSGAGAAERASRRQTPWKIVLDPGHGGRDPGAHGPRGTREKDVVLAIARKVRQKLRSASGIEPILTREDDRFLPLAERSRRAVKEGADLFLSLHANAARDRRAKGFETYFLGEARTEWARKVAMRENSAVRYEDRSGESATSDVQAILANMDLNLFREESSFLAGTIQNALRERVSAPDRGVKQNIYLVLANAGGSMPAVLVEAGFISNPESERRLRSDAGQEAVAEAVAEAVVRYFRERERRQGVYTAAR